MTRLQGLLAQLPKLAIPLPHTSFTLFPNLPSELRNNIWKYAVMVPRDINLQYKDSLALGDHQPRAPAILLTSSKPRAEGKRYYTFCPVLTKSPDKHRRRRANTRPTVWVWINFTVDKFVWSQPPIPEILQGTTLVQIELDELCFVIDDIGKIQHLCLDFVAESFNTDQFLYYLREMTKLLRSESLGKVTVMAEHSIAHKSKDHNLLAIDVDLNGMILSMQNAVLQEQEKAGWNLPFDIEINHVFLEPSYASIFDFRSRYEVTRK
jgi:hypothetical protein